MVATSIAMLLLFGALYGTGESFAVVQEGDARVHTHIHGRRILDRLLKDCRYAAEIEIQGEAETAWTLEILAKLDDPVRVWHWNSKSQNLTLSQGENREVVLQGIQQFDLKTQREWVDGVDGLSQVAVQWTLAVNAGTEAGAASFARTISLGAATWIRSHAP